MHINSTASKITFRIHSALKAFILFFLFSFCSIAGLYAQDVSNLAYPYDPASEVQPGVAKGELLRFSFSDSKIFPGTRRSYWIYIPAAYTPAHPACLFVNLDGVQFNAPVVFDNLIAKGEMPVTIGVFIEAGTIMKNDTTVLRYNRSNEFDNTNDQFVQFILGEILPDVEKQKATDGRAIRISKNANDHAISGTSSGAICAFTAAWQRPDAFNRVFSAIGTYVGMRGGDQYPVLIRKTEPKPIRIFLQDGSNDAWNPLFGSWYKANIDMEAALNFAGYELTHAWGEGGHDGKHATAIFPDAMRWLWKGWPSAVKSGWSANNMLQSILLKNEQWQPVETPNQMIKKLETSTAGDVLLIDSSGKIFQVHKNGETTLFIKKTPGHSAMATDSAGRLYLVGMSAKGGFTVYDKNGTEKNILNKITGSGILIESNGNTYIAAPGRSENETGKLWLLQPGGNKMIVDKDMHLGSEIAASPDRNQLYVSENHSNWICSYAVQDDGSLKYKQRLYWLHNDTNYDFNDVTGMAVDNKGNLYVATAMGVQVCDQNGRVRAILSLPDGAVTGLCFAGENFDTLFIVCNGRLYKRKLNVNGVPAWARPVSAPSQGAG